MNVHEQFADDLAQYALGSLQEDERQAVAKHLEECPACRHELGKLQGDLALLGFSASGPRTPARSRVRLMAAIAKEPRVVQPSKRIRWPWWNALGWAAAVVTIAIAVLQKQQNFNLRQRVAELEAGLSKQDQQLLESKQLLATLSSPDAAHFTLVTRKAPPQPEGKAIYVRGNGTLVFLASNFPAIPSQKSYELWLIPTTGAPIPAGLFKPDAHGAAVVIHPTLPIGVEAKAFAVTLEPESGSPAPTSQPIIVSAES